MRFISCSFGCHFPSSVMRPRPNDLLLLQQVRARDKMWSEGIWFSAEGWTFLITGDHFHFRLNLPLLARCPSVVPLHVSWHVCPPDARLCVCAMCTHSVRAACARGWGRGFPFLISWFKCHILIQPYLIELIHPKIVWNLVLVWSCLNLLMNSNQLNELSTIAFNWSLLSFMLLPLNISPAVAGDAYCESHDSRMQLLS